MKELIVGSLSHSNCGQIKDKRKANRDIHEQNNIKNNNNTQ